jgi:hypothetical protein
MLAPRGALASSVGAVIGVGPGRGVSFAFVVFGFTLILVTVGGALTRRLRRFDLDVPDALPDDLVGAEERKRRLAATTRRHPHRPSGQVAENGNSIGGGGVSP